jgi:hypothetical protein
MNILTRLKKMENQLNVGSEFCRCEKEFQTVVVIPAADGDWATLDGKPYVEPPEFCETCGKPNPERLIIAGVKGSDAPKTN